MKLSPRVGLLGSAMLAVVLAWVIAPAGVPIYDGIGNPDEPYRFVDPPANSKTTKAPTSARGTVAAKDGRNGSLLFEASNEQGPQVTVSIPTGSLRDPLAKSIGVVAKPIAPTTQPAGAKIDGNVYQVSFTADAGKVTPTGPISIAYIAMRATSARQPGPTMYFRTTGSWRALRTSRVGNDIYQSRIPAAGEFALAFANNAHESSGTPALLIVLGIALGVVVVLLVAIRLARRRTS
jgi:hypothetical protein